MTIVGSSGILVASEQFNVETRKVIVDNLFERLEKIRPEEPVIVTLFGCCVLKMVIVDSDCRQRWRAVERDEHAKLW
jgi:hypothetical protein